ncbi:unnamed protein product, partial [Dovyalis caffra]
AGTLARGRLRHGLVTSLGAGRYEPMRLHGSQQVGHACVPTYNEPIRWLAVGLL